MLVCQGTELPVERRFLGMRQRGPMIKHAPEEVGGIWGLGGKIQRGKSEGHLLS